MSPTLRWYLIAWYALGAVALAYAFRHVPFPELPKLSIFILFSLVLNVKTVRGSNRSGTASVTVSLSSAAAFAAILSIHPAAGALVEASSNMMDSFFPKRRPLYQALFNIAVCSVGTLAAGLTYQALHGPPLLFGKMFSIEMIGQATGPMLAASVVYFLVNTLAMAEVVALASEMRFLNVWRRSCWNTFVGDTSGAACAVMVMGFWSYIPPISLLTLCLPVIYACYSREQFDEARVVALERNKERLQEMYLASVRTLALTVAARDHYTNRHIHRVAAYALAIARQMGFTQEELTDLETGAILHDIGKIGVPEHILTKPGRLTAEEMAMMRRHAEIGWAILDPLDYSPIVKLIVRHHHERFDGTGYPDGLKGDEMPLMVRIVSVCDVFDALTSERPYRGPLSVSAARDIMAEMSGKHFDPTVLQALFTVLDTVPWEELKAIPSDSPVLTELLGKTPGLLASPAPQSAAIAAQFLTRVAPDPAPSN